MDACRKCQWYKLNEEATQANLKDNKEPQIHRTRQEIFIGK